MIPIGAQAFDRGYQGESTRKNGGLCGAWQSSRRLKDYKVSRGHIGVKVPVIESMLLSSSMGSPATGE